MAITSSQFEVIAEEAGLSVEELQEAIDNNELVLDEDNLSLSLPDGTPYLDDLPVEPSTPYEARFDPENEAYDPTDYQELIKQHKRASNAKRRHLQALDKGDYDLAESQRLKYEEARLAYDAADKRPDPDPFDDEPRPWQPIEEVEAPSREDERVVYSRGDFETDEDFAFNDAVNDHIDGLYDEIANIEDEDEYNDAADILEDYLDSNAFDNEMQSLYGDDSDDNDILSGSYNDYIDSLTQEDTTGVVTEEETVTEEPEEEETVEEDLVLTEEDDDVLSGIEDEVQEDDDVFVLPDFEVTTDRLTDEEEELEELGEKLSETSTNVPLTPIDMGDPLVDAFPENTFTDVLQEKPFDQSKIDEISNRFKGTRFDFNRWLASNPQTQEGLSSLVKEFITPEGIIDITKKDLFFDKLANYLTEGGLNDLNAFQGSVAFLEGLTNSNLIDVPFAGTAISNLYDKIITPETQAKVQDFLPSDKTKAALGLASALTGVGGEAMLGLSLIDTLTSDDPAFATTAGTIADTLFSDPTLSRAVQEGLPPAQQQQREQLADFYEAFGFERGGDLITTTLSDEYNPLTGQYESPADPSVLNSLKEIASRTGQTIEGVLDTIGFEGSKLFGSKLNQAILSSLTGNPASGIIAGGITDILTPTGQDLSDYLYGRGIDPTQLSPSDISYFRGDGGFDKNLASQYYNPVTNTYDLPEDFYSSQDPILNRIISGDLSFTDALGEIGSNTLEGLGLDTGNNTEESYIDSDGTLVLPDFEVTTQLDNPAPPVAPVTPVTPVAPPVAPVTNTSTDTIDIFDVNIDDNIFDLGEFSVTTTGFEPREPESPLPNLGIFPAYKNEGGTGIFTGTETSTGTGTEISTTKTNQDITPQPVDGSGTINTNTMATPAQEGAGYDPAYELAKLLVGAEAAETFRGKGLASGDLQSLVNQYQSNVEQASFDRSAALIGSDQDLRNRLRSGQRASDVALLGDQGQAFAEGVRGLDPTSQALLGRQTELANRLYDEAAGGLSPERSMDAAEAAFASRASQGRSRDESYGAANILNREGFRQQAEQRAQQAGARGFDMSRAMSQNIPSMLLGQSSSGVGAISPVFSAADAANLSFQNYTQQQNFAAQERAREVYTQQFNRAAEQNDLSGMEQAANILNQINQGFGVAEQGVDFLKNLPSNVETIIDAGKDAVGSILGGDDTDATPVGDLSFNDFNTNTEGLNLNQPSTQLTTGFETVQSGASGGGFGQYGGGSFGQEVLGGGSSTQLTTGFEGLDNLQNINEVLSLLNPTITGAEGYINPYDSYGADDVFNNSGSANLTGFLGQPVSSQGSYFGSNSLSLF